MERYLIEIICFQALFLGVYWLWFRKSTFFRAHRAYLLITPALAMLLPFVKIAAFQKVVPATVSAVFLPEVILGSDSMASVATVSEVAGIQWSLQWVYIAGVIISALLFTLKMYKLTRFFKFRRASECIIEVPQSTEAFTFLNYIFIGEEIDTLSRKHILAHEHIHLEQRHTWDLLAFEALRIVLWFNPCIYLYQKEIASVHEYLADAAVLKQTTKQDYYEKLLNTAFGTSNLSFTNTFFNHSSIKNRIAMLQKSKSTKTEVFKYTLIIPMVLGMLFYVSCSEDGADRPKSDTEVMDQIVILSEAIMRKGNLTDDEMLALKFLSTEAKEGDKIYLSVDEFIQEHKAKLKDSKPVSKYTNGDSTEDVPFSIVEEVPVYQGCDGSASNADRKECMSNKINQFISQEFDTSIGSMNGLSGLQRIYVLFKIDTEGNIFGVRARAPHPSLKEEAERVIKSLPKMDRGAMQNGELVNVSYTQPIIFKIED